jgi:hypothetical protein
MEPDTNRKRVVVIGGGPTGLGLSMSMLNLGQAIVAVDAPAQKPRHLPQAYSKRLRFYSQALIIRDQSGSILDIIFPMATHHDRIWIKDVKRQFIGCAPEEWVSFIIEYEQQDNVFFLANSSSVKSRGFKHLRKR